MKNSQRAFTLPELLITLVIGSILLSLALPAFSNAIKNNRITTSTNELLGAFRFARAEAIKRGDSVHLGQRDGSNWSNGAVVWIDADGDGNWDSGEELRLWESFNSTIVSSYNSRTVFMFRGSGEVNVDDTMSICDDRTAESGRQMALLLSGLSVSSTYTCS